MPKSIYIQSKSDVPAIAKLLKQAGDSAVVLVAPKDSVLFRVPGKIRQLAEIASGMDVQVTIVTTSAGGRRLAASSGFKVLKGREGTPARGGAFINDPIKRRDEPKQDAFGHFSEIVKRVLPSAPKKISRTGPGIKPVGSLPRLSDKSPVARSASIVPKKIVVAALVLIAVFAAAFTYLPSAEIVVAGRSEPVARDIEIQVESGKNEIDLASLTIPGTIVQKTIEGGGAFNPTGKKNIGKKASGFVQIYNLSKNTLILKSETTTLSFGGREYIFAQDIGGIRPTAFIGQGDDQEVDESSLIAPVPVIAAAAGQEYNLSGGTRLEIANQVFGSNPDQLYAQASGDISGGSTLEVRVLTENDVVQGLQVTKERTISDLAKVLAEDAAGLVLLDSGVKSEVAEESVSHSVGDQASEFSVAVKMEIRALAFSREDVEEVVRGRVERLLPENKKLIFGEEAVLESRFFFINFEDGTGVLTNHFESRIVYEIDTSELRKKAAGKTEDEIKEILLSRSDIESVSVRFSPFWVKTAPRFLSRIRIEKE